MTEPGKNEILELLRTIRSAQDQHSQKLDELISRLATLERLGDEHARRDRPPTR